MPSEKKLIAYLKTAKQTISSAESCSGGYASYLLTKTAGASKVFKGGIIVYSLESKNSFFKLPLPLLKKKQGVSKNIAVALAKGVKKLFKSDIGISIVGFAGPGTAKGIKPGTVFIAVAVKKEIQAEKLIIKGTRDQVRKKASKALLTLTLKLVSS